MLLSGPALAIIASSTLASALESSSNQIRGLDPALLPHYTRNSTHFHCLATNDPIPLSAINDDYCDCPDGSDEPGTAACEGRPEATGFWCENRGHVPGIVRAGRVNDGLCDDECCDGSDEWATGACPDRCEEIGKEYRTRVAAEAQTRKTGAKIRGTYIKHAKAERKRLEDDLSKKRAEVSEKESEVERLRVALEGVEAKSHAELERRKQSSLFQTLLAQRSLLSRLRAQTTSLQKELDDLHGILDDLRKGYNPNYQDMAVKAAVVGYEELTGISRGGPDSSSSTATRGGDDGAADGIDESGQQGEGEDIEDQKDRLEEEVKKEETVEKVSEWELDQAERKDLEGLLLEEMDSTASASGGDEEGSATGLCESPRAPPPVLIFCSARPPSSSESVFWVGRADILVYKIDEYIPDFLFESFDSLREALAEFLVKWGVFGKVAKTTGGGNEAPHTAAARQRHTDASNALHRLQRDIASTQETLDKLSGTGYGREGEWKKLDGTCIDKVSGDYTYELCFFGSATQKSNKDHSSNHLGTYVQWNIKAEEGTDEYYSEQGYRNGAKCWNGPSRSVDVILSCGTKNELLSVSEPEKCEYRFKVTSPAMCWPAATEHGGEGTVVLADKGKVEL